MTPSKEMNGTPTPSSSQVKRANLNGVNTEQLFATINAVKEQPVAAAFCFRASNTWIRGTHSRTRCERFSGAGGEHEHTQAFEYDGDHPQVLCGAGAAPTPIEYLLGSLAACLTAGIGNIAAARGIELEEVTSFVEGDVDLQGLLGLDPGVRNGYQAIRTRFYIKGDASAENLRRVIEQSKNRSAVFDVLTRGVAITIDVEAVDNRIAQSRATAGATA